MHWLKKAFHWSPLLNAADYKRLLVMLSIREKCQEGSAAGVSCTFYDEHRTRGMTDDRLGHAAHEEPSETRSAVRSQNDHVGLLFLGQVVDRLVCLSLPYKGLGRYTGSIGLLFYVGHEALCFADEILYRFGRLGIKFRRHVNDRQDLQLTSICLCESDRALRCRSTVFRSVCRKNDPFPAHRRSVRDNEDVPLRMADDPRRHAPDERTLDAAQPTPSHDDNIAVLSVGEVYDPLVDLAFFTYCLDEHPLSPGYILDLGERVFTGLSQSSPDVLDPDNFDLAFIRRHHRRDRYPAFLFIRQFERLVERVPAGFRTIDGD